MRSSVLGAPFTVVALLLGVAELHAQSGAIEGVREYRKAHEFQIVAELVEFLSIPNVATDLDDMRRNAEALVTLMEERGIRTRLLETEGPPYVYGELPVAGAERTVMFYAHYDGQPVDPDRWRGHAPFDPILRDGPIELGGEISDYPKKGGFDPDWRIYARSASDDKSPIVAMLVALDALRSQGLTPTSNLKFIFEGDEEMGSPNLEDVIDRYGQLLQADLLVAADGPRDPSGLPTLFFGVRGIVTAEITVYGPLRPLHSGHYGNWAPNPAMRLAHLLASMKDAETGRVLVDGFYDDVVPLSDLERRAIKEAPVDDAEEMREFAIAAPELRGSRLEVINQPSLNVRGMRSAWVGSEARTIVPDVAVASIDMRLVKDIDPGEQLGRLVEHIRRQGYYVVRDDPSLEERRRHPLLAKVVTADGYPAFRTPMELPVARSLITAVERHTGTTAVKLPTLGGSVPLYYFTDVLGVPTVGVPIVNHDNNQHSPNENLRLGHFFSGIEILVAPMLME